MMKTIKLVQLPDKNNLKKKSIKKEKKLFWLQYKCIDIS